MAIRKSLRTCVVSLVAALMTGCCLLFPCDGRNHVGGYVRDSAGKPIAEAKVEFYGVTQVTDKDGCFYFGGTLAAPGFQIAAAKPGYKPYAGGRRFALYEIDITLVEESAAGNSQATWTELSTAQISASPSCGK